jgi:hypothetical protein
MIQSLWHPSHILKFASFLYSVDSVDTMSMAETENDSSSFDSDEFSEVDSIYSNDPQPSQPTNDPQTSQSTNNPQTSQPTSDHGQEGQTPFKFKFDGKEYIEVKEAKVAKRKHPRTSVVWKLGREVKRVGEQTSFPYWRCSICKGKGIITVLSCKATSGPMRHIESHGYKKYKGRLIRLRKEKEAEGPNAPRPFLTISAMEEFRSLLLQWIICCHIALSMIENPLFRGLIEFINVLIIQFLPSSSNTLRQWVIDEYKREKALKKKALQNARSRITISFDTWTSPFSKKHVLSIIAHFVDENWKRDHLQLSMCRLYGSHSGENLAEHIVTIIRDWEIESRVGYIVTDNEASNGVAVDHIFETLEPETYQSIRPKKAKKAALRKRWVRCLAHTLNLISQAFLFGQDPEKFLMNTDGAELRGDLDVLIELWRKRGFIGKISNIVRYIRRSPKQRAEFERIRVNDSTKDVYWIAVEEVEDDEQLEVSTFISNYSQG